MYAVCLIAAVLAISLLVGYFWFGGMDAVTGDRLFHKIILALTCGIAYGLANFWEMKPKK